jgi:hypothetical protein
MKRILSAVAAMVVALSGGRAAASDQPGAAEPVKLADGDLDQVTAGAGSLLPLNLDVNVLLQDISVNVNLSNVPVNAAVALQANVLGQAIQNATVIAGQHVTQAQMLPPR